MGKKLTLMLFILLSHSDSSEQFCKIEMKNKRTHFGGSYTSVSCVTDKSMLSPPRLSPHCKAGQTEQIIKATDYFTHLFICSTNAHWMLNVSQITPCTRDIVMNRLEQKGKALIWLVLGCLCTLCPGQSSAPGRSSAKLSQQKHTPGHCASDRSWQRCTEQCEAQKGMRRATTLSSG